MFEFKNVSKNYQKKKGTPIKALNNISFTLNSTGLIFLVGKSGSGKSTLLNIMGGIDNIDSGTIILNNKEFNKFKPSEMDAYRNSYIGFIFQEFNLLEEFNVYQNIELSLDLKRMKKDKNAILKSLEMVEMKDMENRRINELSGGEKQRVGIARALIKNPRIILADEPTGNLDSNTSEQIFKILKNISKTKLVVVVTHDVDSALNYADRIIELKDGKILKDETYRETENIDETKEMMSPKLSTINSCRIALANLKQKKLRLIITIILVTFALSFFTFSYSLTNYDLPNSHANAMVKNNESNIIIKRTINGKETNVNKGLSVFTNTHLEEIEKKLNVPYKKVIKINENNGYQKIELGDASNPEYAYYNLFMYENRFIAFPNSELNNISIIGKIPSNKNEILIHKILADYIINRGVGVVKQNALGENELVNYKPENYEELINGNEEILFGSNKLKISGIINENLEKYESLKTLRVEEVYDNPPALYKEFEERFNTLTYTFIVNEEFFNNLEMPSNTLLDTNIYATKTFYETERLYGYTTNYIEFLNENEKLNIYDGTSYKEITNSDLQEDEIILGVMSLDEITNNDFSESKQKALEDYKDNITLSDFEASYRKFYMNFLQSYINENSIIGSNITIQITDTYNRINDQGETIKKTFKIKGIEYENGTSHYINKSNLEKYMRDNIETMYLTLNVKEKEKLENIFKEFPESKEKYISTTIYSNSIKTIKKTIKKLSPIMTYLSLAFLIFGILLFMNYIILSINANKKRIGILRSLGARKIDTLKIFYTEGVLIGLTSFIISSLLCIYFIKFGNIYISKELFFDIEPLIFNDKTILALLIIVILVVLVSSSISILKISKLNPIDAINNK